MFRRGQFEGQNNSGWHLEGPFLRGIFGCLREPPQEWLVDQPSTIPVPNLNEGQDSGWHLEGPCFFFFEKVVGGQENPRVPMSTISGENKTKNNIAGGLVGQSAWLLRRLSLGALRDGGLGEVRGELGLADRGRARRKLPLVRSRQKPLAQWRTPFVCFFFGRVAL